MWDLEEQSDQLLEMEMPLSDSLLVIDFGEMTITPDTRTSGSITPGLRAFATDSGWVGEKSPVFYVPSYQGSYPALTVAPKLSWTPSDTLTYTEALDSGRLELAAYRDAQQRASMRMAESALETMRAGGLTLLDYAEAESLEVLGTGSFMPLQTIAGSGTSGGLLGNTTFGFDVLLSPELEPIGPYSTGTSAAVAEITSRQRQSIPEGAMALRYMTLQAQQLRGYKSDLVAHLRRSGEVIDLREEYVARVDSLRAAQDTTDAE